MRTTVVVLLGLGLAFAQEKDAAKEKPKDNKPEEKLKGFLPAGFKKLGLSDKQVQAIYKVQAAYRARRDELARQLERLKEAEREEVEKTLTEAQRKELKAIRSGEKPKDKP